MKKVLAVFAALLVAVGGYFVVNADWSFLIPEKKQPEQQTKLLSEQEARTLLSNKYAGDLLAIDFKNGETPYYIATIHTTTAEIVVEVDAISKRLTEVSKQSHQTLVNTESTEEPHTTTEVKPIELPLTKNSAQQLALAQLDGEVKQLVLVEKNGTQYFEVTVANEQEAAIYLFNIATGELDEEATKQTSNDPIGSVANALKNKQTAKSEPSSSTKNESETITKPEINQTDAPTVADLTQEEVESIALRSVPGTLQQSKQTKDLFYEVTVAKDNGDIYIVKVNPRNGFVISRTKK